MKRRSKGYDILPNQLVLIACNNAEVRKRWRKELEKKFLVREASQPGDLEKCIMHLKPSVLLLDASLQELGAAEAVSAVQRLSPSTRLVLLTGSLDQKEGNRCPQSGGKGILSSGCQPCSSRENRSGRPERGDMDRTVCNPLPSRRAWFLGRALAKRVSYRNEHRRASTC